ncbi:MAG: hypothetical protein K2P55_06850 [Bacteroides acidifaciens]|uniref:hypothetical protein n=1 Tax=Bacteroides acidifaciens TaxID=85831 RepID=UPI0023BEBAFC|nr:hypothetical protein [Bacteroides acidifaciens]MDE6986641.1 hypothetical protein [Bacteroides acidifaciens]
MAINETLKFSWGHIIAFVALIFISYVSFMGITYLTDGDFLYAALGVLIINLILIVFFIIPQILKGADEKFSRKIVFERILFFAAPIFFIAAMVPYTHFWTVFENRNEIETTFSESIKTTKGMFDSYEAYANSRIKEYDKKLAQDKTNAVHRSNEVEALRLQIIADNYNALKESAIKWIDNASGATVWNVFMIGNIKKIEGAIENWNSSLNNFSSKIMSDEPSGVEPFSSSDPSVTTAKGNLNNLRSVYTTMGAPTMLSIGIGLLLYILLLFPYIIQSRNTKSTYRLIGSEGDSSIPRPKKAKKNKKIDRPEDDMTFCMDESDSSSDGDYGSFTM